ncbi:hypothetical protein [Flagellimonas pacifica]|uniref:Lipocalin-like domain-containing protein n=1 Tax=Flagellimonas pacifica TaxID=1247520 RepID=A0A285MDI7_9FLAO|nr:hypothetical protein [Allomuricauda parva]SNY95235.1 hypothetical protein SAMN06265377_0901 [Allomuricauda parva]
MRFFLLLVVLLGLGCSNDDENFEIDSFYDCKKGTEKDFSISSSEVIGKWKWIESSCSFCLDPKPYRADKKVIAEFKSDKTYMVVEDSKVVSEGTWDIQEKQSIFIMVLDPKPKYLDGTILVCQNQLISDARPWDGVGYLFTRN